MLIRYGRDARTHARERERGDRPAAGRGQLIVTAGKTALEFHQGRAVLAVDKMVMLLRVSPPNYRSIAVQGTSDRGGRHASIRPARACQCVKSRCRDDAGATGNMGAL